MNGLSVNESTFNRVDDWLSDMVNDSMLCHDYEMAEKYSEMQQELREYVGC